ncbi:MAG: VCBS domain-containing protein [Bradyrhizobium sp.]|nr:VCBS domain-containing protein [Bradyrhizobium sp.]
MFSSQGAFSGAGESFSVDVHPRSNALGHGGPDTIVVPDAHLLFSGDYKRSGLDLVLSKDGHEFVARDYFRGESRSVLASPDGASLSGSTVEALTGQVDYAQAGGNIAPAKIIGQVTKVTGSATAVRNGVSITLNVGDNVHKGDVVQSGSDSSLGITFMDGTVFGLSSNARMVLNEMIYDPAGSSNASLLTLVQGTISFVAGATAKTGDMKVETPTATMGIRGTAVLVEIDFDIFQPGLAPPVSFRILVEPNGETGEYVLLDKLTGQPIATVNQPGTKTVVNGQGAVTFFPSAEIPANAQRLINEIFTLKFTDANPKYIGIPPLDTITPQSFLAKLPDGTPIDQLPIIRITLVLEPVAPPPPSGGNTRFHLNIPPDLLASSNQFTERLLTSGNTALDTVSGIIHFDDINPEDRPTVSAQFNSYVYRDAQQEVILTSSLTLEQLAAIQAVQVPLSVVQHAGNTNVGDGTWTYSVPDHALDFLAEGETLTLIYMARVDTNYIGYNTVVFTPFKITITGANDLPTATATGSGIIELDGTNNPDINHAEGVIAFADVDLTDRPTVTAPFANYVYTAANGSVLTLTPAQQAALAATLTLTPAQGNTNNGSVAWSYDVADANFDFIAAGETLVLTYHATVDDGHGGIVIVPLTLTVTVNGTNDIPTITATSDGFVELVGTTNNTTPDHAGGTITFTDVDLTDRPAISAPFSGYTYTATNGITPLTLTPAQLNALAIALTLDPSPTNANNGSVTWSYDLADNQFDFLAGGETLVLTYTATVNDGHGGVVTTPITVTVTGTNDAPAITAIAQSDLDEQTDTSALTATIPVTFTDVDLTDVGHTAQITQAVASGVTTGLLLDEGDLIGLINVGTVTKNAGSSAGSLNLNFTAASTAFDYLAVGEILTLTYTVAIDDHDGGTTPQTFVVTITGSNDAPVIDAIAQQGLTEQTDTTALTATIQVTFADVDLTDVGHTAQVTHAVPTGVTMGLALDEAALIALVTPSTVTKATGSSSGSLSLGFAAASTAFDYLGVGDTLTLTYTVAINDLDGGITSQTFVVTIAGTNDIPTIAGIATGGVTEDVAVDNTNHINASGLLTIADADAGQSSFAVQASTAGSYGSFTLAANGTWTYTADNTQAAIQQLGANGTLTDSFTAVSSDGTASQVVTITIHGTNDTPTISTANLQISQTGPITISGLSMSDVDGSDTFAITASAASGSTVTLVSSPASGSLADINSTLAAGITYDPGQTPPQTDMVSLTVEDASGATDTVNFIFNVTDPLQGNAVTLASTSETDVLFGTDYEDMFVFTANSNDDTIINFTAGIDQIDLSALSSIVDSSNIDDFLAENVTSLDNNNTDTLITLSGSDTIILRNVVYTSLQASDFIVHA